MVPERIGRYEVLLPIASGGMGTVYLARSRGVGGFQREVALKVMHAHLREEEHFATDLIEEAKLAVRIQHPNVVQVIDVGEDPHGVFLVMEYIEGDSLAGLVRACRKQERALPPPIGIRVLVDALRGLHAAHELCDENDEPLHLVHRDFSPQNIIVGQDGISRLTDFGVAKARTRLSHTATGLVKGKIHYMSPEQARTDAIDRRCDVWAGGVMVWEILAGRRLYKERNDASVLLKLVTEPPARVRTVRRDVAQALEDVVAHALATDVSRRCPTAKRLADELLAAARAHGGVAEAAEVAAFVAEMSGQSLRTRRSQVGEVLKLRQEIKTIARASTVDANELTTSPAAGASLGAHDDIDDVGDLSDDTTVAATEHSEETQVTHSTHSTLVPPAHTRRSALLMTAAAGVAVLATAGYVFSRAPAVATGTTPAPSFEAPASASARGEPPPVSVATTPPVVSSKAAAPVSVTITANAPVTELTVGARKVPVKPPASTVDVPLEASENASSVVVVARAADGRLTRATLAPHATALRVEFATAHVAQPRPRPTAAPLATNPHQ